MEGSEGGLAESERLLGVPGRGLSRLCQCSWLLHTLRWAERVGGTSRLVCPSALQSHCQAPMSPFQASTRSLPEVLLPAACCGARMTCLTPFLGPRSSPTGPQAELREAAGRLAFVSQHSPYLRLFWPQVALPSTQICLQTCFWPMAWAPFPSRTQYRGSLPSAP